MMERNSQPLNTACISHTMYHKIYMMHLKQSDFPYGAVYYLIHLFTED